MCPRRNRKDDEEETADRVSENRNTRSGQENWEPRSVMTTERVYLSPPHLGTAEMEYVKEAFASNWVAPLGPNVDRFEAEVAKYVGIESAAALSSGTAAIHLGLVILGVKAGDEVLCPTFTFAASANPIVYLGAKPVFIDSEAATWNIDPDLLASELADCARRGRMPKAVIAVDLYGLCADYDRIEQICDDYGVPLIEDAAEALGASYKGRMAGCFGELGVFSFNGNKIITSSGGGMLVSSNPSIGKRARFLATQARDPAPHYEHTTVGYNYRLSNVLAGIGRGQLQVLDQRIAARKGNRELYVKRLQKIPGIGFNPEVAGMKSNYWITCISIDSRFYGAGAETVRAELEARNIESRPVWKPLHLQKCFEGCRVRGGMVAESIFEGGLCLPSGSNLKEEELDRICDVIREVHENARR